MADDHTVVRSLLIPINEQHLLLPNAVVAEVSHYAPPQPIADEQPDWLLGIVLWRQQQVPLLSLEALFGLPKISPTKKHRTVILYGFLAAIETLPFYAFTAVDVPRAMNLAVPHLNDSSSQTPKGIAFSVQLFNQTAVWLPDLAYLENLLMQQLSTQVPPHDS